MQVLGEVASRFGVQPEVVVAIWGIETSFGALKGDYDAAEALARLAFTEEARALAPPAFLLLSPLIVQTRAICHAQSARVEGATGE